MVRNLLTAFLALVSSLAIAGKTGAAFIAPSGLAPGDQFRIVFLTDATTDGTSTSASHYDGLASSEAAAAGLGTYGGSSVTWEAIVSTATTSAISRLPADNVPLLLPDGTLVASGGAALWGTGLGTPLSHSINEDATSTVFGGAGFGPDVWTGTFWHGTTAPGARVGESHPVWGSSAQIDTGWVELNEGPPSNQFPVYGFSSVLTVVPEPGTMTLALGGLGGLAGLLLFRRRPASMDSR